MEVVRELLVLLGASAAQLHVGAELALRVLALVRRDAPAAEKRDIDQRRRRSRDIEKLCVCSVQVYTT